MNDIKKIESITKLNMKQHNRLLRFFSKSDLQTKVAIFKKQREVFFTLKNLHKTVDKPILSYSSLVISIYAERKNINSNAKIFKIRKFRRSLKREKIIEKWAVVKSLKINEKLSFRQISMYLRKYYRLNVSYSLIYKIWTELEEKI